MLEVAPRLNWDEVLALYDHFHESNQRVYGSESAIQEGARTVIRQLLPASYTGVTLSMVMWRGEVSISSQCGYVKRAPWKR